MELALDQVTAVVLAGGFGTRIRHVLPDVPKPMAPVAGRPFVEWVVRFLAREGVKNVLLSTGYLADVIERHFAGTDFDDLTVRCIRETTPLGTAGGFFNAAQQSGEAPGGWLVLNGDSLIFSHLQPMVQQVNETKAGAAIMGLEVPDASRYGTLQIGRAGELVRFSEKQAGAATINAGVYLFRSDVVREFPAKRPLSFEQDVFPELLEKKIRISATPVSAPFLDIGTEASLKEADAFISTNLKYFQANKPACV